MDSNPHWISDCKSQSAEKLVIGAVFEGTVIVGPFFIEGKLFAMIYLDMLKDDILMSVLDEIGDSPAILQQECT